MRPTTKDDAEMNTFARTMTTSDDFRLGTLRMLPIAASVIPFGLALGAMAIQKGLSPFEIALMGLMVFAGASQFVAVELWAEPIPTLTIIGITAMVNLRHILMGASLSPALRPYGNSPSHLALYFMTDEVWALVMQRKNEGKLSLAFYGACAFTICSAWVVSLYLGAMAGGVIENPARWGLDFAGTAIFLTLLCGFWEGRTTSLLPWLAAGTISVLTSELVDGPWYILSGGLSAMTVRAFLYKEAPHA